MRRASLLLAMLLLFALVGCVQDLGPVLDDLSTSPSAGPPPDSSQAPVPSVSSPASWQGYNTKGEYVYEPEMMRVVNDVLESYADGAYPEPMRYNSNYTGILNHPPRDSELPLAVSLKDVDYEIRYSENSKTDYIVVSLKLENDYTMDVHIDTDGAEGEGVPTRATAVYYYDMLGTTVEAYVNARSGGEFSNVRSDRLYASADFSNIHTEAGRVSGSITWGKANKFLWIDIDSMRTPFFYTYFVTDGGGLVQDYPQKEWQRSDVVNDEKMMTIAQSLFGQFKSALDGTEYVPPASSSSSSSRRAADA